MSDGTLSRADSPISTDALPDVPRILLMRHAQTHANAQGYFLGSRDEGLTDEGLAQSRRAVAGLCAWKPDRIVSSPLSRCRTFIAQPAAEELGVPLTVDERVREFDFGPLEGMTYEEIVRRELPFPWGPGSEAWPPERGGESMEHFVARLADIARSLVQLPGRTAVVCHGGVIRGFFSVWFSMGPEVINHLVVPNVSSCVLRNVEGSISLEQFGLPPELLAM